MSDDQTKICNPYAALVALRKGLKFQEIHLRLSVSDPVNPVNWAAAIGGAMAMLNKSSSLFHEIQLLDAFIENLALTARLPVEDENRSQPG
ncbi:MAG: hypothetical protein U0930_05010 [Pirellulales bacterium]